MLKTSAAEVWDGSSFWFKTGAFGCTVATFRKCPDAIPTYANCKSRPSTSPWSSASAWPKDQGACSGHRLCARKNWRNSCKWPRWLRSLEIGGRWRWWPKMVPQDAVKRRKVEKKDAATATMLEFLPWIFVIKMDVLAEASPAHMQTSCQGSRMPTRS